jgi:S-DNA-T family DNA segregation ATPase FtsK/SpoIIIE
MDEIIVGPTVTRYSLKPAEGVRLSKIVALQSNLELALAASPIRIEAPIPGKSLVGIEVPNTGKAIVGLGGLLSSPEFSDDPHPLLTALGKDIAGKAHYGNISKMPHLLVAGTTGSGKSVMIHTLITSLLYRNSPERLRFIMVDPKRVELTLYNNIPHLLTPVITDAKKCILSLKWAAKEMERRYDILQQNRVQDLASYHKEVVNPVLALYQKNTEKGKDTSSVEMPDLLPHIVVIIDELADIMSAYPRELESAIVRLAQMSRAVGIHLILSTQRPSVNVITGLIKANIPTRIALKVASLVDSRTILDQPGAEKLLGAGDMLYLSGDMPKPRRIQSPFLSTSEVRNLVAFLIKHNNYTLPAGIDLGGNENGTAVEETPAQGARSDISFDDLERSDELDPLYDEVRAFVVQEKKISTSLLQRRFKVGYGRAARILDQLEENGVIAGSQDGGGNKGREVLQYDGE